MDTRRTARIAILVVSLALLLPVGLLAVPSGAATPMVAAAPAGAAVDRVPEVGWRSQTVSLEVRGYTLTGEEAQPATWAGTGLWVGPDLLATNAHVVVRAISIVGEDDAGSSFTFPRVLALDLERDLALLRSSRASAARPVRYARRPTDPRSLRGADVEAVGNTGGLGQSLYAGHIVNVVDVDGEERILHDAAVSHGASGGPLFAADGRLLGLNSAIQPQLRFSIAVPAWTVEDFVRVAGTDPGVPLDGLFMPQSAEDLPLETIVRQPLCLSPGEHTAITLELGGPTDLFVAALPARDDLPYLMAVGVPHAEPIALAMGAGEQARAVTMPGGGPVQIVLALPVAAPVPLCLSITAQRAAWEKRLP